MWESMQKSFAYSENEIYDTIEKYEIRKATEEALIGN
jgi:hypothetical protein